MSEPTFLTLAEIHELHEMSLLRYGGARGIRDAGGLEAAVEQPKYTYYYGHGDLFDIAAAYAFHVAQAQACIDGNKRTAVAAALVFLKSHVEPRRRSATNQSSDKSPHSITLTLLGMRHPMPLPHPFVP